MIFTEAAQQLYVAFFGRPADPGGRKNFGEAIEFILPQLKSIEDLVFNYRSELVGFNQARQTDGQAPRPAILSLLSSFTDAAETGRHEQDQQLGFHQREPGLVAAEGAELLGVRGQLGAVHPGQEGPAEVAPGGHDGPVHHLLVFVQPVHVRQGKARLHASGGGSGEVEGLHDPRGAPVARQPARRRALGRRCRHGPR